MNDRELMERYKMALESIVALAVPSDQSYKISKQALIKQPEQKTNESDKPRNKEIIGGY